MKSLRNYSLFSIIIFLVVSCTNKEPMNNSVKAQFTVSGYEVPAPCDISFFNTSINATSWKWTFGDGTSSTEFNPTHTYSTIGSYYIKLVAEGSGRRDSVCKIMYLDNVVANKSTFSYFMDRCEGVPVNVSFYSLNPLSRNYAWEFGNGLGNLTRNPVIQYTSRGNYSISFSSLIGSKRDTTLFGIQID